MVNDFIDWILEEMATRLAYLSRIIDK